MKQIVVLLAATAAALVTPNEAKKHQISLGNQNKATNQNAVQAWWDELPDASSLLSPVQDRITKSIQRSTLDSILALVENDDEEEEDHPHPQPPHDGHGHHGDSDKTIYELIKESKHTTKFAKLVDEYDEIKKLLDDTEHNYTLFVPTDRAFERIPHHRHGHHGDDDDDDKHDHKRCKEFVLSLLKYHIAPGLYPGSRIRSSHTLPTLLHPSALSTKSHDDNHPQRIRAFTTPLLHFTRLNFHARLIPANRPARNGLIHALDAILLPPPSQTALVRLLPGQFSTLALALETTGLGAELDKIPRSGGGTLFAPTNRAWARLGPRVNAFLFSERGKKYLRALVKYHVVVNETLYSDEFYRGNGGGGGDNGEEKGEGRDYWHVDLPSLLGGKPISVDVKTWKGFVSIVVNGFTRVVVRDGVADDGVLQVVGRVLIPPHEHHGGHGVGEGSEEGEVSLEELKSRLEPYLKDEGVAGGREGMEDL
jgi:uncharacterized surface protein with fasciclin (FAS1) repeats